MSLLASRVALRHRCTIQRDASAAGPAGGWNQSADPNWQNHLTDLPCRAWTESAREPVDEGRTAVTEERRLALALGSDVTEKDRVLVVTDRGTTRFEGPMNIEGVLNFPDHMELILERIR